MTQIERQPNAKPQQTLPGAFRPAAAASRTVWSFIYIFFTNGIPFDAPNRSEPCPPV